jgi:Condensation domain/TubC N-terminal docking domain
MNKLTNSQFLELLSRKNIRIHSKDGRLQISAPKGAIDSQLHTELVRRKSDLLTLLEKTENPAQSLLARPRDGQRIPQTPAQQGLWLIEHHEPGNVAYNIPEAFLINAHVELIALQEAVNQLLIRHEMLRTSFHEDDGDLFQAISAEARADAEFTDLSFLPEASHDQILRKLIQDHARQPFDLRRPPLARFHLFRLGQQKHVLFLNIHHIISDRKSVDIIREELVALYQEIISTIPANLPELPVQYADYAIWMTEQTDGKAIEKQIGYWKRKLAGLPPFLELPHRHPYPKKRTSWGATLPVTIPLSLRDLLVKVAAEENTTPFITYLAVLALLLYLYSGSEDFCIGSPITDRRHVATERMVGLFLNMLAFRCQLTQEYSFREILRRIRETALQAYDNSDVPFQKLVRALKPDRRFQRSPIFQVTFGFESHLNAKVDLLQIHTEPGTARYDLTLNLTENRDGVSGSFEYCTDLFDESDIVKLAQGLAIVDEAAREPDQSISEVISRSYVQDNPVT